MHFFKITFILLMLIINHNCVAIEQNIEAKSTLEQNEQLIGEREEEWKARFGQCEHDMTLGNEKAPVVVIEYFSYTCPHCVHYQKNILPEIQKKYIDTNKILYIVREFTSNKQDLLAGILARCNKNKNSFFTFLDVLMEQQNMWATNHKYLDILTNIGQLGGVSSETYALCQDDRELVDLLIANAKLVALIPGFTGTPALFINGKQFTKTRTIDMISEAIEAALAENLQYSQKF
jgi:protein-disulfide isomerase